MHDKNADLDSNPNGFLNLESRFLNTSDVFEACDSHHWSRKIPFLLFRDYSDKLGIVNNSNNMLCI